MKRLKTYQKFFESVDADKFGISPGRYKNSYYLTYNGNRIGNVDFTFDSDYMKYVARHFKNQKGDKFDKELDRNEAFLMGISLIKSYRGYNVGIKLLKQIMIENNINTFYFWGSKSHKLWNRLAEELGYYDDSGYAIYKLNIDKL